MLIIAIDHMSTKEELPGLDLPPPPQAPHHSECCGRGCEHCVYVYYEEAIRRWEERIIALKAEYSSRHSNAHD